MLRVVLSTQMHISKSSCLVPSLTVWSDICKNVLSSLRFECASMTGCLGKQIIEGGQLQSVCEKYRNHRYCQDVEQEKERLYVAKKKLETQSACARNVTTEQSLEHALRGIKALLTSQDAPDPDEETAAVRSPGEMTELEKLEDFLDPAGYDEQITVIAEQLQMFEEHGIPGWSLQLPVHEEEQEEEHGEQGEQEQKEEEPAVPSKSDPVPLESKIEEPVDLIKKTEDAPPAAADAPDSSPVDAFLEKNREKMQSYFDRHDLDAVITGSSIGWELDFCCCCAEWHYE